MTRNIESRQNSYETKSEYLKDKLWQNLFAVNQNMIKILVIGDSNISFS